MSPTFGSNQQPSKYAQKIICTTLEKMAYHFQMAEKYLVKVIEPNIAAKSFDDLRYVIYATRKISFSKLAVTSSVITGHLV